MEIWLDANISPVIATWVRVEFSYQCFALREMGLRDASDPVIFRAAKTKGDVVLITKDEDFCKLLQNGTSPPKIIWLTIGNCSNMKLKEILKRDLPKALTLLAENDLVEISQ
jgi:predicted nuclease of predicted toxin-antitoxin system